MNFHLVSDNPVYIDHFIESAEKLSDKRNCYVLISPKKKENIKSNKVLQFDLDQALSLFRKDKFNKVFIHYLNNKAISFIDKIDKNIPVYWFFWGADGYKHPKLQKSLYLPETKNIVDELFPKKGIDQIKKKYRDFKISQKLNRAFLRIDYCCTQVKGDFDLIKSISPTCKMHHLYFAYGGIDNVNYKKSNKVTNKKFNILLGNSANPSNNHLDILHILSGYTANIEKIICPLSYSGPKDYINQVILKGEFYFGEKFYPLIEFLPLNEYETMMDTIDIGVFYHSRQQAYSNTIMILGQGKKILMNPKSTLYDMYLDFGIKNVYSDFGVLLDSSIIEDNKLQERLGAKIIDDWYNNLLN